MWLILRKNKNRLIGHTNTLTSGNPSYVSFICTYKLKSLERVG